MGFRIPKKIDSVTHIEAVTVWKTVVFLINGAVFILIGLQLPHIMDDLVHIPVGELIVFPILINVAHIAIRFAWVFATMYLPAQFSPTIRARYPYLTWKHALVVGWCGMRGVVSLAAGMSLPLVLEGVAVGDRSIIVYLTFTVIFFTLVVQGLTLPLLIKKLNLINEEQDLLDEAELKKKIAQTAITRLKEISAEDHDIHPQLVQRLEHKYEDRLAWANRIIHHVPDSSNIYHLRSKEIQRSVLRAQRDEVIRLHEEGLISTQLLRKILSNIDFESAHLSESS
jgi:NhaP-type Na+/H+ and K+/H+ antiporter